MAIITLGGNLGAGKTTLAERLAPELGYDQLYVGGIFREMAKERGISIEEFYSEIKRNPEIEAAIDERQGKLMHERDNLVVQGRVAWKFVQGSPFRVINICLLVDPRIGAERSHERTENQNKTVEEVLKANIERARIEQERYRMLYGIENFLDAKHYDVVLETSRMTRDQVLNSVLAEVKRRLLTVNAGK